MTDQLLRLYPQPGEHRALRGLYLGHELHRLGGADVPFVYANFITTLDGRIALRDSEQGRDYVPDRLSNPNDFRLLLELHAQADCLITHGGYLRALAEGREGNVLHLGAAGEAHGDLGLWRRAQGLDPEPAIVVASASLDFPDPRFAVAAGQRVLIATGCEAATADVRRWRSRGYEVLVAGTGRLVEGGPLADQLAGLGYRSVYLMAGPAMLETMLRDRRLSRLYLSITHQILGGVPFRSLSEGPALGAGGALRLRELWFDASSPEGMGQWFAQFECAP